MDDKQIQDDKARFVGIIKDNVTRDGINAVMAFLDNSDFYIAPASTQYHNACDGGLLNHSLNVYDCLVRLNDTFNLSFKPESMAISALFHDICKTNVYVKGTRNRKNALGQWEAVDIWEFKDSLPLGHGEKSVIMLQSMGLKLTKNELFTIRWHMAGFDNAVKGGERGMSSAYEQSPLAAALNMADMAATYLTEARV